MNNEEQEQLDVCQPRYFMRKKLLQTNSKRWDAGIHGYPAPATATKCQERCMLHTARRPASSALQGLAGIPANAHSLPQRPVLCAGHVEEQGPDPGDIDFAVVEDTFVGVGLYKLADKDVMEGVIQDIMEPEFHVDRTLTNHRGCPQFAVKNIEQRRLVGLLAGHDAAVVGFDEKVLAGKTDAECPVFPDPSGRTGMPIPSNCPGPSIFVYILPFLSTIRYPLTPVTTLP